MTNTAAQPSTTVVESATSMVSYLRALDLFAKAEAFLRDSKSVLEHCPGYSTLRSQLDLSVPFLQTAVDNRSVDCFRIQRTIELLRALHTVLFDESTRRNIHSFDVGVIEWARLVLAIPGVIDALKAILHRPATAAAVTTTHR